MIEPFGQPPMPLRDIVLAEHFGNLPPLYFEPFGNITIARCTTGFSTSPGVSQCTSTLSLTPRGFFFVPGLSGVTFASAVTVGHRRVLRAGRRGDDRGPRHGDAEHGHYELLHASLSLCDCRDRFCKRKRTQTARIGRRGSHRVGFRRPQAAAHASAAARGPTYGQQRRLDQVGQQRRQLGTRPAAMRRKIVS